ncbi:MAG: DUF3310 domain-containing protein [Bifidobacterium animalis]|nr:DUF3310 domain-containing protein [Bifidobacterium animalis]MDY5039773.1 DUF3310 domain-containing protein [Bifidobacterium animalis]
MTDSVNHPSHYEANGPFECIELTEHYDFCMGNAIKYIWRHMSKGKPVEDLHKALWYIEREKVLTGGAPDYIPYNAPWWYHYEEQDERIHQLASIDFAHMKNFWQALEHRDFDRMKHAIENRIQALTQYDQQQSLADAMDEAGKIICGNIHKACEVLDAIFDKIADQLAQERNE